ncbi:MAG: Uma2 family endonuclease [Acidobacteriota bacterium]
MTDHGPFHADQLRQGDRYELSAGHAIWCSPTGGRGARASLIGGTVLASDPDVTSAGLDAGFSPTPDSLRAPDVSVGNVPDQPGWIQGVPQLAVEYADVGQDETDLAVKIRELLAAGTRWVWVVRLVGPRRVEVHAAGQSMRLANPGEELRAPGVLRNPVAVEALYEPQAGLDATLRNLLQRQGFDSLEAVRATELRESLLEVFAARGLAVDEAAQSAIAACNDPAVLRRWHRAALVAETAEATLLG